jgi:hypothetical protein
MPTTKADIIRQASTLLGKSAVNQTSSSGPIGAALEDAYNRLLPAILEGDDWRFAAATQELNRLEHTSNVPRYKYVYQLPANYLRLNKTIPELIDYDIQENYLYTNVTTLTAEFRFLVDASKFSHTFTDFLVYKIALDVTPIALVKPEYATWLERQADKKYLKALASNGQSIPPRDIVDKPFINAGFW